MEHHEPPDVAAGSSKSNEADVSAYIQTGFAPPGSAAPLDHHHHPGSASFPPPFYGPYLSRPPPPYPYPYPYPHSYHQPASGSTNFAPYYDPGAPYHLAPAYPPPAPPFAPQLPTTYSPNPHVLDPSLTLATSAPPGAASSAASTSSSFNAPHLAPSLDENDDPWNLAAFANPTFSNTSTSFNNPTMPLTPFVPPDEWLDADGTLSTDGSPTSLGPPRAATPPPAARPPLSPHNSPRKNLAEFKKPRVEKRVGKKKGAPHAESVRDRMLERAAGKVTTEGLQARNAELEGVKHNRTLMAATLKNHARSEGYFQAYLRVLFGDGADAYDPSKATDEALLRLSLGQWKGYADFLAGLLKGHDSRNATVGTITTEMAVAISWYGRLHPHRLMPEDRVQLTTYINHDCAQKHALSTVKRVKPIPSAEDFFLLVRAAYQSSTVVRCARERTQIVALLQTLAYGAARPGEVVMNMCYQEENASLLWKASVDLEFIIFNPTSSEGSVKVAVMVTDRLLKGKRNDESAFKKFGLFEEEITNKGLDPTLPFLAMAFDDDVFEYCSSAAQLYTTMLKPGERRTLSLKNSIKDTPVFRQIVRSLSGEWGPDSTASWSYNCANSMLQRVVLSAGFLEPVTFYALRRLSSNALNVSTVSALDLKAAIGHNPDSHVFAAVSGFKRAEDAPTKLSDAGLAEVMEDPSLNALLEEMAKLKKDISRCYKKMKDADEANDPTHVEYAAKLIQKNNLLAKLKKLKLRAEREEFDRQRELELFEKEPADSTSTSTPSAPTNSKESTSFDTPSTSEPAPPDAHSRDPITTSLPTAESLTSDTAAPNTTATSTTATDTTTTSTTVTSDESAHDALGEEDEEAGEVSLSRAAKEIALGKLAVKLGDTSSKAPRPGIADALAVALWGEPTEESTPSAAELIKLMNEPIPQENGYRGESVTGNNTCPICSKKAPEGGVRRAADHVHDCIASFLCQEYRAALTSQLEADPPSNGKWDCPWIGCKSKNSSKSSLQELCLHLDQHFANLLKHSKKLFKQDELTCPLPPLPGDLASGLDESEMDDGGQPDKRKAGSCGKPLDGCRHHFEEHGYVFTASTTTYQKGTGFVRYCLICNTWLVGGPDTEAHASSHISTVVEELLTEPTSFYPTAGTSRRPGPAFCPFCVFDESRPDWNRLTNFMQPLVLLEHINNVHLLPLLTLSDQSASCPVLSCSSLPRFSSPHLLANHLINTHAIPLAGYDDPYATPLVRTTADEELGNLKSAQRTTKKRATLASNAEGGPKKAKKAKKAKQA